MGSPTRIAHISTIDMTLRFLLRDHLRAFREAGYEVVAISAPGPWVSELEADGVIHIPVTAFRRRVDPLADLRAFATLVKALRRSHPVLIHTHTPKARIFGRLAGRLVGVPIMVNTYHGLYGVYGSRVKRWMWLWLERLTSRWSAFEFSQSLEDLHTLHQERIIGPDRSVCLGNGVNLDVFDPSSVNRGAARIRLGIEPSAIVIGTVGRLVWEKGYGEFFEMAETLKRDHRGIVILAIGPRDSEKADAVSDDVIDDLSRRGIVRFLGLRTDMPELYASMDIFVLPSYREGFPRAAIEATALELPVVASDIQGCRQVIEDGRNGFLVPPHDVGLLLDRVRKLIADPDLRERLGREGRRRAIMEFDERRVIAVVLDAYRRLLRERDYVRIVHHQESTT